MRQMFSGLVAAFAVLTAGAAPAMACGGLLGGGGCSPCQTYVSPCGQPAYSVDGYSYGYGVAEFERLPDPTQYYYVNQGPTFSGPGNFAPVPTYDERSVAGWGGYAYRGSRYASTRHYAGAPAWRHARYGYRMHPRRAPIGYYGHPRGYRMHHSAMHRGAMHPGMRMHHAGPRYRHHMAPRRYY